MATFETLKDRPTALSPAGRRERPARLVLAAPGAVLTATAVIAIAAGIVLLLVSGSLAPFSLRDPGSGSERARARLAHATGVDPDSSVLALVNLPAGFGAPASTTQLAAVARTMRADPHAAGVLLPSEGGPLVAQGGRAALVVMLLRAGALEGHLDAARRIEARLAGQRDVLVGGQAAFYANGNRVAERDLLRTDVIATVLLIPLCFIFFRSAVAALFVTLVGGLTVLLTFAGLALLAHLTEISAYTRNVVSGLGLGLGVDYSLLLVTRLREEAGLDGYGPRALERTLDTAGRTITPGLRRAAARLVRGNCLGVGFKEQVAVVAAVPRPGWSGRWGHLWSPWSGSLAVKYRVEGQKSPLVAARIPARSGSVR